jgi:hypothetical protein
MLVIVGLIVLLAAAIDGVLSSAGAGHPLTDFTVFGYHLTGSTGTLFLFGIAVGAVASLGLCVHPPEIPPKLYRSKGPISVPTQLF